MKIRLLTGRVDERNAWSTGDVLEVDAAEAKRLIEAGDAEPVARKAVDKAETR